MKFYLVAEVAEILRLSESQVYALIGGGRLRCHRLTTGKQGGIRISESQLQEYLKSTEGTAESVRPAVPLRHINLSE